MFSLNFLKSCLYIVPLSFLSFQAHADLRLDRIKQNSELKIGYVADDFPFNYLHNGQPSGFGIDLATKISQKLSQNLGISKIELTFEPITLSNRFDLINNGTVDIACGAHSNTLERKKIVDFSYNYFLARSRLLTSTESGINLYGDLKGKIIGVNKGSLGESVVRQRRDKIQYQALKVSSNYADMVEALFNDQIHAAIGDDVLLKSLMAMQGGGKDWKFIGPAITIDRYACVLPKGEKDLKHEIDKALNEIMISGEVGKLFEQWFQGEIDSPKGRVNLNFEFSVAIQTLYTNPTDIGIGE